jgi:hypothetical protein
MPCFFNLNATVSGLKSAFVLWSAFQNRKQNRLKSKKSSAALVMPVAAEDFIKLEGF